METANDYHVNMFKMKSPYAKANARLIISTIIVWFIAVIGFQFLLLAIEKPVPEKSYLTFTELQPRLIEAAIGMDERAQYAKSILMVLAKNPTKSDKNELMQSFNFAIEALVPAPIFKSGDAGQIGEIVANKMGVGSNSLESKILPYIIDTKVPALLSPNTEKLMAKYLIHNRSFLTDTRFLGFPFHYWYTAEFLLILFVFLCWFYCIKINKLQKKFNIKDE